MSHCNISRLGPGRLLIINHKEFTDKKWNRPGSEMDAELLRKHFGQFQVSSKEILNPTLEEVKLQINKMRDHDFSKHSCFICAILSHGDKKNAILSSDLKSYLLDEDVIEPIQRNKTLIGKPKIFIVQACKGGTEIDNQCNIIPKKKVNNVCTDHAYRTDCANCSESWDQRDPGKCWKFCSTSEDFVSYRFPETGSIFINSFCNMLSKFGGELSIEEIFDLASKEIQRKTSEMGVKQIPSKTIQEQMNYIFGDYCN